MSEVVEHGTQADNMWLSGDCHSIINELDMFREQLCFESPDPRIKLKMLKIIEQFDNSYDTDVVCKCAFCLRTALEVDIGNSRLLMQGKVIPIMARRFAELDYIGTSEHCAHCLEKMSKYFAVNIVDCIDYGAVFEAMESFENLEKRSLMTLLTNVSETRVTPDLVRYVQHIVRYADSSDVKISTSALKVLMNVVLGMTKSQGNVEPWVILYVAKHVTLGHEHAIQMRLLWLLNELANNSDNVKVLIDANIDFDKLFFSPEIQNDTHNYQERVLSLIIQILPGYPGGEVLRLPPDRNLPESIEFAKSIQPIIRKVLHEKPLSSKALLVSLLLSCRVSPVTLDDELIMDLLPFVSFAKDFAPYILAIFNTFTDLTVAVDSKIDYFLYKAQVAEEYRTWYMESLNKLIESMKVVGKTRSHNNINDMTLEEIADLIDAGKLSPVQWLGENAWASAQKQIDAIEDGQRTPALDTIAKFVFSMVRLIPLGMVNHNDQIMNMRTFIDHLRRTRLAHLSLNGKVESFMVPMKEQLSYVEGLVCRSLSKYNLRAIEVAMKTTMTERAKYVKVDPDRLADVPISHWPILVRAFANENVRIFYAGGYTGNDSVFGFFCDSSAGPGDIATVVPVLEVARSRQEPVMKVAPFPGRQGTTSLMATIEKLKVKFGYSFVSRAFVSRIHNFLVLPLNSIGRFFYGMKFILEYPYLFPFEERVFGLKLILLEPYLAVKRLMFEFRIRPERLDALKLAPLKLVVSRKEIFEDGLVLLRYFLSHRISVDISFREDEGVGVGPTREFFGTMALEFTRVGRGLFRNDKPSSEFCYTQHGLFPSVNAPPPMFRLLGVLVAKALALDMNLPLDFNPAFFSMTFGRPVTCGDIDPFFRQFMGNPLGLYDLDFTYPGYPDVELVPDGQNIVVDESNVQSYIQAIEEFTLGRTVKQCAREFIRGFSDVFPFKSFNIFSSDEMVDVVRGPVGLVTMDDLNNYVRISDGYVRQSPQIDMLFGCLVDFTVGQQRDFFLFVTGSTCVPTGGIKYMDPPMTVSKKITDSARCDTELPTSSTCTCHLKLPEYSSVEIMKAKLVLAISCCRNTFDRT